MSWGAGVVIINGPIVIELVSILSFDWAIVIETFQTFKKTVKSIFDDLQWLITQFTLLSVFHLCMGIKSTKVCKAPSKSGIQNKPRGFLLRTDTSFIVFLRFEWFKFSLDV